MSIPVFVFYELLIRLSDLNPAVGDYFSHSLKEKEVILQTTTGVIAIPQQLIKKQFTDPRMVADKELKVLVERFMKS